MRRRIYDAWNVLKATRIIEEMDDRDKTFWINKEMLEELFDDVDSQSEDLNLNIGVSPDKDGDNLCENGVSNVPMISKTPSKRARLNPEQESAAKTEQNEEELAYDLRGLDT